MACMACGAAGREHGADLYPREPDDSRRRQAAAYGGDFSI